jgi:hypothetical protein
LREEGMKKEGRERKKQRETEKERGFIIHVKCTRIIKGKALDYIDVFIPHVVTAFVFI